MKTLMTASNQWANRPADERYWNLKHLLSELEVERFRQKEKVYPLSQLVAAAGGDGGELCIRGPKGKEARMTNWSFGQLCSEIKAPASYLRTLPAELAATNINHGLKRYSYSEYDNGNRKLLFHNTGNNMMVRSLTGEDYGRIWNDELALHLRATNDLGWVTPPARPAVDDPRARPATKEDILPNQGDFGLSVKLGDMIAPAGVYCGDRDIFVFLVNPERIIDDGVKGLMRGVFIRNSEVGSASFTVTTFYMENVCGNHIVWGPSNIQEIKIIHRKNAPDNYITQMIPQLRAYANASVSGEEEMIYSARNYILGEDKPGVVSRLFGNKKIGMTKGEIELAYDSAEQWEHTAKAPPTSVWGMVHGLTRASQDTNYADERNRLDRAAGRLLQLAAGGRAAH